MMITAQLIESAGITTFTEVKEGIQDELDKRAFPALRELQVRQTSG